jgi:organic radical activating enzyme
MRGKNPIRAPEKGDGSTLFVQHIFPTLQGEGPYAGVPAVFIRLGGCNLACAFCDTEFESFREMRLEEILGQVLALARGAFKLIVITGGEPLRQPIGPLCAALIAAGFKVQIETNGTLWRELPDEVEIVCSPKNTGKGYFPVRPDLQARVNAFKFIISAHQPEYAFVGDAGQGGTPVFVQPMDEYNDAKNEANLKLAAELAQRNGYRLSLQLHKIVGIE